MSKFPTGFDPKGFFENLLARIKQHPPSTVKADVGPHLHKFLADPSIQSILALGQAPAPSSSSANNAELQAVQQTLKSLTKAITDIQKKVSHPSKVTANTKHGKGNAKPSHKTYSAVAGSRPPNPSLVVDLAHLGLEPASRPRPEAVCVTLNRKLSEITPSQPQLAAARWTARGNLVLTGDHTASPSSLQNAAPHIRSIIMHAFKLSSSSPTIIPQPRANVKWSKISINGVPTGASPTGPPRSPEECHNTLKELNPVYATLTITQRPSWVRTPSSYNEGAISSLSVAFEDPDGSKLKTLLAERYLYAFGIRATVKKWKYRQKINKEASKKQADQHDQGSEATTDDEEDVEISLTPLNPRPDTPDNIFRPGNPLPTGYNPFQPPKITTGPPRDTKGKFIKRT